MAQWVVNRGNIKSVHPGTIRTIFPHILTIPPLNCLYPHIKVYKAILGCVPNTRIDTCIEFHDPCLFSIHVPISAAAIRLPWTLLVIERF